MDVILHRVVNTGKTICQVIKAPKQFSWYGKRPMKRYSEEMKEMLTRIKEHGRILNNEKFQYFYAYKLVTPKWAKSMDCKKIGRHHFCKLKERK